MSPEFYGIDKLRNRLAGVRRRLLISTSGIGVALVLISSVSLLSIGMAADWFGELPLIGRAALLLVNLGLISLIAHRQIVIPLQAVPDEDGCALLVEQARPDLRTRLIACVQLTRPGVLQAGDSTGMVRELIGQTNMLAEQINFRAVVSFRRFTVCGLMSVFVLVAAMIVLRASAPATGVLLRRAFLMNVPVPHKTHTQVLSGNIRIGQGENVVIEARATGVIPGRGRVLIQYVSDQHQQFAILPTNDDKMHFTQTFENVHESFTYRVCLNDDISEQFMVSVFERPAVISLECQQIFPAYTHLPARRLAPADLPLLAGSRLQLTVHANKEIATAGLRLAGLNTEMPLHISPVDQKLLTGEISVPQAGLTGFTVQLCDTNGLTAKELTLYQIDILPDKPPTVILTLPERKEELVTTRAVVLLGIEARDDFGVAKLTLHYRSSAIRAGQEQNVELNLDGKTPRMLQRRHEWDLANISNVLPANTAIEYWIEAQDTNDVTGPGRAATEHYWLKVVSTDDKRTDLMNRLDDYLGTLDKVAEDEEQLNKNVGSLIFVKPQQTQDK